MKLLAVLAALAALCCRADAPNRPGSNVGFTDVLQRSCLMKDVRPIAYAKPHPTSAGAVYLYFERPRSKKPDRFLVTREQFQQLQLKKGVKLCWDDSLAD